jgi:hypothetical protein
VKEKGAMSGIHVVTDEKGRKIAVQIDLKKHGAIFGRTSGTVWCPNRAEKKRAFPTNKTASSD